MVKPPCQGVRHIDVADATIRLPSPRYGDCLRPTPRDAVWLSEATGSTVIVRASRPSGLDATRSAVCWPAVPCMASQILSPVADRTAIDGEDVVAFTNIEARPRQRRVDERVPVLAGVDALDPGAALLDARSAPRSPTLGPVLFESLYVSPPKTN